MKNILIALTILALTSCGSFDEKYSCSKGTITVLKKEKYPCLRGGGYCAFSLYIFDGKEANWYEADERTYNSYNINDTLPTIVLTIIKTEK